MTDLAGLLIIAIDAVDRAREIVLNPPDKTSLEKGDRDMVTATDIAIEKSVFEYLSVRTPNINFLGEENGQVELSDGLDWWALDPVDGTANFVRNLPLCAVSLGLIRAGKQQLGVIDLPFLAARYTAAEGFGAFGNDQPIEPSDTKYLAKSIVSLGDYAVGANATAKNRIRISLTEALAARVQRVRMFGSAAIDLVWVAEGKLDACLMLSNNPWDTAAGVAIARQAGAKVMDIDGSEHTFGSTATIAAAPGIADEFIDLVRSVMDRQRAET